MIYNSPKIFQDQALINNSIILAINSTRIQLTSIPGNNKIIIPINLHLIKNIPVTAYTHTGSEPIYLTYTTTFDDGGVGGLVIPYNFLHNTNSDLVSILVQPPENNDSNIINSLTFAVNKPVYLWGDSTAYTGGAIENYLRVTLSYLILDITTGLFVSE